LRHAGERAGSHSAPLCATNGATADIRPV